MRRFLIAVIAVLLTFMLLWNGFFNWGIFFGEKEKVHADFCTEGTGFYVCGENGAREQLSVKGVDLSPITAGHYATDFAANETDYLCWLEAIGQMGANTVRVSIVMDADFYNALYAYNTTHPEPLYLLQGIRVTDAANGGREDAFSKEFRDILLWEGRSAVDVIHGRKERTANTATGGTGLYLRDVSRWVLGFLVGQDWDPGNIAYTNHSQTHSNSYLGQYFATTDDSTIFEALMAQIMDEITGYESRKYGRQRPIAFICDPETDFLEFERENPLGLGKFCRMDPERVVPGEKMTAGCFAAYRLYDYCPDYTQCLTEAQIQRLGQSFGLFGAGKVYDGYLEVLRQHHTMPLVAAGFGFSSARGTVKENTPPLTEAQQGQMIVKVYNALRGADWAGGFISEWQDNWGRDTWNTAFATGVNRSYLWHNIQSDGQNYGLMAFEPGQERGVCTVDGDPGEWAGDTPVINAGDRAVYVRWDQEGIYLLAAGVSAGEEAVIPIDINPSLGADSWNGLRFDCGADFLLRLNGEQDSRLLVQERYDATRENYLYPIAGVDPFVDRPARDSDVFATVSMAVRLQTVRAQSEEALMDGAWQQTLSAWDTGRLIHGVRNPEDPGYNSLADFCYGGDCVEVRLPWLLLNVGDPTRMLIHGDYYRNYGVNLERVRGFRIGISGEGDTVATAAVPFRGLGNNQPEVRERLKQSYYVVQGAWRGGDHAGNQ